MQVDVVVTDRNDRPVTDLKATDFEIWERGRKQTIADFELISVPLGERPIDLTAVPPPPADVATNAPPPRTARAFVFVLDDASLEARYIVWIKQWMTEFLSALQPEDQVALTYVSRSDLGQDFTHDVGRLIRSVNNLRAALDAGADCSDTLPVLRNVVASMSAARETRHVAILISEGLKPPRGKYNCGDEMLALYEQARRAGVPFYTFDPRGLMAPELGFEGHLEDQTPEARAAKDAAIVQAKESLLRLSLNTGGRGFVYQSDSPRAIRDIMVENGSYYLLGYYPNPDAADGRFHDIDVKVTRPGLRIRARAGYTAPKAVSPDAPKPRLVDALADGLPGGDLLVTGFVAPFGLSKNRARAILTLDVAYPASDTAEGRRDDDVKLVWIALDPDARVRASGQNTVRVPAATAGRDAFTAAINHVLDVPKGTVVIRVAVASRVLGRQGVVHLPLAAQTFSGKTIELTPIVLGTTAAQPAAIVGLGGSARLLPFQPTTARTFTTADRVQIFSRVFTAAPAAVTAELVLKRGDAVVRQTPVRLTSTTDKDVVECRVTMSLEGLIAGRYVLELTAREGDKRASRAVPVEIK